MCHQLTGTYSDSTWSETVHRIPASEMEDMSAFSHPELGFRHTPNGSGVYYFTRRIGVQRGLYSQNLMCRAIMRPPNDRQLSLPKQVALVYNGNMMGFMEALTRLNETNGHTRGFAVTPQFAITRDAGNNNRYLLHYNGDVAGTCTREGAAEFRIGAVKRLFEKVA